jgi:SAM-dependent methyltransferase
MSFLARLAFELSYLLRRAPWDSGVSPPELLAFLAAHPPGRALDLGCGTGTNAITLARHGWQVIGIDFIPRAIRRARGKALAAGVSVDFRQGDATDLRSVEGPFDLVLDIGCYHSLRPALQVRYAANLARLVRPGGIFLLYGFARGCPEDPRGWLSEEALAARLGASFKLPSAVYGTDRRRPSAWFTLIRKG